jgi:hypothetical protein
MKRMRKSAGLSRETQLALGERLRAAYSNFVNRIPPGLVSLGNQATVQRVAAKGSVPAPLSADRVGTLDADVFDPETIAVLDEAYRKAWIDLQSLKHNPVSQDALVRQLIALVKAGERRPNNMAIKAVLSLVAPSTAGVK